MDKEKQPGIICETILLAKLSFERKPAISDKPEIDLNLSAKNSISEDRKNLNIELTLSVVDKKESFNINCTMIGVFKVNSDEANMPLEKFSEVNGPAIILPYLREIVSNTTMRSGMFPVVIPPINVSALLHKNIDKT